jgi:membrane protease YdiL (CAAX protease family)
VLGLSIIAFVQWRRLRRLVLPVMGDVEPLLPRNGRERLIAIPLSLNAGFSEELFFRLALPLLIAHVTGSAVAALAIATVAFGLVHAYQGWKGVAGTALIGGVLMIQYLVHGSLLRVMVIHAAIDLVALLVRPALGEWLARRQPVRSAVRA